MTEKVLKPHIWTDSEDFLNIEWIFGPARFGIGQGGADEPDTWYLVVKPEFEAWAGELPQGWINWDVVRDAFRPGGNGETCSPPQEDAVVISAEGGT